MTTVEIAQSEALIKPQGKKRKTPQRMNFFYERCRGDGTTKFHVIVSDFMADYLREALTELRHEMKLIPKPVPPLEYPEEAPDFND